MKTRLFIPAIAILLAFVVTGNLAAQETFWTLGDDSASNPKSISSPNTTPVAGTTAADTPEFITPEINAVAQGLNKDPLRIFDFVRNHIRYVHYFGSKKGAHVTLLEKSGNDFDQCALLVALLRAAGFENVLYEFGAVRMPYQSSAQPDIKRWLGLTMDYSAASWTGIRNYLSQFNYQRGFPMMGGGNYYLLYDNAVVSDENGDGYVWWLRPVVRLVVGTYVHRLDPSLKVHTVVSGLDLTSKMEFNASDMLSKIKLGAGVTEDYVQNLNSGELTNLLATYTGKLLNALNGPNPNLTVMEVVGGIRQEQSESTVLPTSAPFKMEAVNFTAQPGGTVSIPIQSWTTIPSKYKAKMVVEFDNLSVTFEFPGLRGRKVSITFDTTYQLIPGHSPLGTGITSADYDKYVTTKLSLADGAPVAQSLQPVKTWNDIPIKTGIDHPFGHWIYTTNPQEVSERSDFDQGLSTLKYQAAGAPTVYVLLYGFDAPNERLLKSQETLNSNLRTFGEGTTQTVGEGLHVIGLSWVQQTYSANALLSAMNNVDGFYHHWCGRVGSETGSRQGYFVDLPWNTSANMGRSVDANNAHRLSTFEVGAYFLSALEHSVIEQWQNNKSASTIKLLHMANASGNKIVLASANNWSTATNYLSQYSGAQVQAFAALVGSGSNNKLLLPANSSTLVGQHWNGFGYILRNPGQMGMRIDGGYPTAGGFAGTHSPYNSIFADAAYLYSPGLLTITQPSLSIPMGADPVSMVDGSFVNESTDLVTGDAEPRGFSFSRHYNSNLRHADNANIAKGWTHNYIVNAVERSDVAAGFGNNTPQEMASMIVGLKTAYEIYRRTPSQNEPQSLLWSASALITEWAVDQLVNNSVNLTLGSRSVQFVRQPTGPGTFAYVPPAGITSTLSKNTEGNYVLQLRHGNKFTFRSDLKLASISDQYDKSMTFSYDAGGKLDQVSDAFGRVLDFEYDANNRLKWVDDNDGNNDQRRVSFSYGTTFSSQGDLLSVTDVEGKQTSFTYDGEHKMVKTYDASTVPRVIVQNFYDDFGRVKEQWNEGNSQKAWKFAYSGFSSIEVDPEGNVKTLYFDAKHRNLGTRDSLGNRSRLEYDGQDHVVKAISPMNEVSTFVYDGRHNLKEQTEAVGVIGQARTSFRHYDTGDHLEKSVDYRGNETLYTYNDKHQLTTVTQPPVNDDPNSGYPANKTTYIYYLNDEYEPGFIILGRAGNLKRIEDQRSIPVILSYDWWGKLRKRQLWQVPAAFKYPTDSAARDYEEFVNNYRGDVVSHSDFRSKTTSYEYNKRRQLTKTTRPGNVIAQVIYDGDGRPWKTIDPTNNVTEQLYDSNGRATVTRLPLLSGFGVPEIENHYNTRNLLEWTEDPLNRRVTYGYDAAGRKASVTDQLSRITSFTYDANGRGKTVTSFLDVNPPQTTTFGYNPRGERDMVSETKYPNQPVRFQYDLNGNQTKVINRKNAEFVTTFYKNNQLATTATPSPKTTTRTYDARGLLFKLKEPSGQESKFEYDDRGQLVVLTDGVSGPSAPTQYAYDANGNLTRVVAGTRSIVWTYDDLQRLTAYTYTDTADAGSGYVLNYQYDNRGNLTRLTYPGGKQVDYEYDSHNRLWKVIDWALRQTVYVYDLSGRLQEVQRAGGSKRKYTYSDAGEITGIVEERATGTPINIFSYKYDLGGRLEREFTAPIPAPYTESTQSIIYNGDNQISTFNGQPVVHDPDGNMTSGPLMSDSPVAYSYDSRNRLTGIGSTTSYGYDPNGNRLSLTQASQTTRFVINPNAGLSQTLVRTRPDGSKTFYVYGAGLLYDVELSSAGTETGVRHVYHQDYRGSTTAITDAAGDVMERIEYSVYGAITRRVGRTVDTPFLFNGVSGVQTDPNGLYYMRARYYNVFLKRFINADPSGLSGGLNLYAYVDGNPVELVDPFGLCSRSGAGTSLLTSGLQSANSFIGPMADGLLNVGIGAYGALNYGLYASGLGNGHSYEAYRGAMDSMNPFAQAGFYDSSSLFASAGRGVLDGALLASPLLKVSGSAAVVTGAANSAPRVLLDSSVTTGLKADAALGGRILPGEVGVKSYVTIPEMRNAVTHGNLRGVPGAAYDLPTLTTQPSLNARINIRGMLPDRPGRFGDGIIGAQALENNMPLIINDKALRAAVEALGGTTR